MDSRAHRTFRIVSGWLSVGLGTACVALITIGFSRGDGGYGGLNARLLPAHMRGQSIWKTIDAKAVNNGATVPANTNVIFHIPDDIFRINRNVLFGKRGDDVRYWGYCFPKDYDQAEALKRRGLPGLIFMSKAEENHWKKKNQDMLIDKFSIFKNLTEPDLNQSKTIHTLIDSRKEMFTSGEVCYMQTEKELPIGADPDQDGLNNRLELNVARSNPKEKDTDGDGLWDGAEYFGGTDPNLRDSDGDNLIDGVEDRNRNGKRDEGESDPRKYDTDGDGLCDGFCLASRGQRQGLPAPKGFVPDRKDIVYGEDLNLNGEVDDGETDPTLKDTDGDGILDDQEYYFCILLGEENCT